MSSSTAARRAASLAVATFLLGLGGVAAPATGSAAGCTATSGVRVVVDDGSPTARCGPGDPEDGISALSSAGFGYTFVPRQNGFVCTIDGYPDPCNNAPADAYWSYWHASPGGSWVYSSQGGYSRDPKPGTVEGWAFGAGQPPGMPPPAHDPPSTPAPSPSPSPPPSPPPAPAPDPAAGSPSGPTGEDSSSQGTPDSPSSAGSNDSPSARGGRTAPGPTSAPGSAVPEPTGTASPLTDETTGSTPEPSDDPSGTPASKAEARDVDARPTSSSTDAGSPTGAVVAGLALLGIGSAGAWQVVSRRRARPGDVGD